MHTSDETRQLVIFYAGQMLCALEASAVAEIFKEQEITYIHRAPEYVRGVINLRGSIVTVVDLKRKLSVDTTKTPKQNVIIVPFKDENVGLLVDDVVDIRNVEAKKIQKPPANLDGISGPFLKGVYPMNEDLIVILDVDAILTKKEAAVSS